MLQSNQIVTQVLHTSQISLRSEVSSRPAIQNILNALDKIVVSWRMESPSRPAQHGVYAAGRPTLTIHPAQLKHVALFFRNYTYSRAATLSEIVGFDRIAERGRFSIQYFFLSDTFKRRLSFEVFAHETSVVPSLAAPFFQGRRIFASAGWLEREVWDMFGTYFTDHGDLRRILTDYGFSGHPLRKSFPLTGFFEVVYNDAEGRVTSEPVELAQEFRVFHL